MACSAVVIEFPNGVFMTMMPRRDAAVMSTLSDADAGPSDNLQVFSRFDKFGRHLCR